MKTARQQLEAAKALRDTFDKRYPELNDAIARLEEAINNQPKEPPVGSVVRWKRRFFANNKMYTWAAIHAHEGYWYVTQAVYFDQGILTPNRGARKPRMTWDELLDFIGDSKIKIANTWKPLS